MTVVTWDGITADSYGDFEKADNSNNPDDADNSVSGGNTIRRIIRIILTV